MRFKFMPFLVVAGLFVFIGHACAADSLYAQLSRKGTVKVFVADPSNASADKKMDLTVLKKQIEETLAARKSLKFEIMPAREGADIAVETEVVEYYWTNHDPIDMIIGTAGAAYDAITIENYSRLQANITVKDTKAGRTLWTEKLRGSVTDKAMTEAEGPVRAGEKLSQQFVIEAFGKKRQSSR